jgi:hypothetical protein
LAPGQSLGSSAGSYFILKRPGWLAGAFFVSAHYPKKTMQDFTLWLEFEHVDFASRWDDETQKQGLPGTWNRENECCNIGVTLPDGRHYGLNVWTYTFLATAVATAAAHGENLGGAYEIPPDLFVRKFTRPCLEATIADLLLKGNLEDLLNPTVRSRPGAA